MATEKRLIYADDARRAIEHADPAFAYYIDNVPTVDAVEVVHGRWITEYWKSGYIKRCYCSECGEPPKEAYNPDNYCRNCGAKMDGERKDNADS